MSAPLRVIVVEDEAIVARDITATLLRLGYQVPAVASTGADAIRFALEHRPDLLLMDMRLRDGLDGIQVAQRILADIQVPIIYLTAFSDTATRERVRAVAPYGYLVKPFDERLLQTTIEVALERYARDQRVRTSESRLRATLQSLGGILVLLDEFDLISFLSPTAEQLLGQPAGAAVGRHFREIFTLRDPHTYTLALSTPAAEHADALPRRYLLDTPAGRQPVDLKISVIQPEPSMPAARLLRMTLAAPAQRSTLLSVQSHKYTVLLVEDEDLVRQATGEMIEYLGYTLLTATNGAHALEVLANSRGQIICVLLDLNMPVLNGVELASILQRERPQLPLIFMSSIGEEYVREHFPSSQITFLQKPFRLAVLRKRLEQACTLVEGHNDNGVAPHSTY